MYGTKEKNRGTKAVISVYEPTVHGGDLYSYSAGIASLFSEQRDTFDYISAGWAVSSLALLFPNFITSVY